MPSTESNSVDVIVIGAGPVGENVADRAVRGGLSAAIVEAELVGGECSYWACIPSKALLRPGAALAAARAVDGASQAVTGSIDATAVLKRRDQFVEDWSDVGQVEWLDSAGITLVRGRGRLDGPRTVVVKDEQGADSRWTANHAVVIATGSTPEAPPIEGLSDVKYWTTREATAAQSVPQRLAVIGGGVSGVELAQAFARLGSEVTILARHKVLGMFPDAARELVLKGLRADGITIREETSPKRIVMAPDGTKLLTISEDDTVECDEVLVSTGRKPNLANIGFATVDIDAGHLETGDDGLVRGIEGNWLYAVGDAAGKVLLTHQGKYEARATGDAIAARAKGALTGDPVAWSPFAATADHVAVPKVVFTDPELVSVGKTADEARHAGLNVKVVERAIDVSGASLRADGYEGWAQMVVDEDRHVIIGVTFAGPDVSDLLHAATIAIVGEVPLDRLWHAVPAFPTVSEIWLRLLESYGL